MSGEESRCLEVAWEMQLRMTLECSMQRDDEAALIQ